MFDAQGTLPSIILTDSSKPSSLEGPVSQHMKAKEEPTFHQNHQINIYIYI